MTASVENVRLALRICLPLLAIILSGTPGCSRGRGGEVTLTVDATERHQVIEGWGATLGQPGIPVHEWQGEPTLENYDSLGVKDPFPPGLREKIIDAAVSNLGLTRFRLEVGPQVEIEKGTFRFDWQDLLVEKWLLPLKERIESRGEPMVVYISYDLGSANTPPWLLEPTNYAEMAVAVLAHLKDTYGIEPKYWSVLNEPGNRRPGDPTLVAGLIAETGARIKEAGFSTMMSGPEVVTPGQFAPYMEAIASTPGAVEVLGQLTYHLYWDQGNTGSRREIRRWAARLGVTSAQTEWLEGRGLEAAEVMHLDLTVADASVWEQYGLAYPENEYNRQGGGDYFLISPDYSGLAMNTSAVYLSHFMRYVRPGATRIGVTSTAGKIMPSAFEGPGGSATLVVINSARRARDLEVSGLAPGGYEAVVSGPDGIGRPAGALPVEEDSPLFFRLPGRSIVTFHKGAE